ncbi:hypothetical protein PAXRUDRAFT_329068 [Paxillus rubicundulus Ve08.2h10]|uniref:Uncharacterized protein n=1 Tax=Paxillus rubicundulus Ve08.2h10 TaxID=930991 RepID=A0A0D0DCF8_9AGAM|nr:hypothetical protein PAXRUDRAFT_329068 [Paxillus rubicundulus Ve08.2h10]
MFVFLQQGMSKLFSAVANMSKTISKTASKTVSKRAPFSTLNYPSKCRNISLAEQVKYQ